MEYTTSTGTGNTGNTSLTSSTRFHVADRYVLGGCLIVTSSPGPSQILSRSCGEKSGEGLGSKLCHGPEMVDSVST